MLDLNRVYKVYSGRANHCMCGCAGKYKVASEHKQFADNDRGYPYGDDEINDTIVRKTVGKILAADDFKIEDNYIFAVINKRIHVAYFQE